MRSKNGSDTRLFAVSYVLVVIWSLLACSRPCSGEQSYVPGQAPLAPRGGPEILVQSGHAGPPVSMALSVRGDLLATADLNNTIKLWDVASGRELRTVPCAHGAGVTDIAFNITGTILASISGGDGVVRLWDVASGREIRSLRPGEGDLSFPVAIAFSPDGQHLAIARGDGDVSLWLTDTYKKLRSFKPPFSSDTLRFSPDGTLIATASFYAPIDHSPRNGDWRVQVWKTENAALVAQFKGQGDWTPRQTVFDVACYLAFCRDGRTLVVGTPDGIMHFLEIESGAVAREIRLGLAYSSSDRFGVSMALSPDGKMIASSWAGTVSLWDATSGDAIGDLRSEEAVGSLPVFMTQPIAWTPDGRSLAECTRTKVSLWDAATRREVRTMGGGLDIPSKMALSPDGRKLAIGGRGALRIWDIANGYQLQSYQCIQATDGAAPLAFGPDSETIVAVIRPFAMIDAPRPPETVLFCHLRDNEITRRLHIAQGVSALAVSPDLKRIAVGGNGRIAVLDAATGDELSSIQIQGDPVYACFSPDADVLAYSVYSRDEIHLLNADTLAPLTVFRFDASSFCFSSDNKLLAAVGVTDSGSDGELRIWEVESGHNKINITRRGNGLLGVALSPDGSLVAAQRIGETTIWKAGTGEEVQSFPTGRSWCPDPVFTFDGRSLVVADEATARLWSISEGKPVCSLYGLNHGRDWLATTPSGYYDCSLDADRLVAWRIGGSVFPFDQFEGKYHRPDVVRLALAGKIDSEHAMSSVPPTPPTLTFSSPAYGAEVSGDAVDVVLKAEGSQQIKRVDMSINGSPLSSGIAQNLDIGQLAGTDRSMKVRVPLPPNEPRVRIRAVAYDTEGLKSRPDEVTIFRPGVKESVGALHILSIGINQYKNPAIPSLKYAVPDARTFAETLEKTSKQYTKVVSKVITDADATLSNLKFALRDLKDTATENDVAVVFISGHGLMDKNGSFYFGTCDLALNDLPMTALDWKDFIGALREVRAKRVLVLADTCHSGGIVGEQSAGNDSLAYQLNKDAHRLVFVSGTRDEVSIGREEWGHGAFTKALVEALEGAADGSDGRLTFQELSDYVTKRVPELTGDRQHPQLPFLGNYEPDAVLVSR